MKILGCKHLILFGFKSSGKTFFGSRLAKEQSCLFIDTDVLIEQLYEKEFQEIDSCRQIALKRGEEIFRALEKTVINNLKPEPRSIIAAGGGAVLNPDNCHKLEELGELIYLEVDKETIRERMFIQGIPSFLDPSDLENSFEQMYAARKLLYEKINARKVTVSRKTDQQILKELSEIIAVQ